MDRTYADIPERLRHFLLGLDGADAFERVLEASGLSEQALIPLSNVVTDFAEGMFPVDELDNRLASGLSISPAVAARVSVAVGREILLPFKDELNIPDLEARIASWEGKARVGALATQTGPAVSPEAFVLSSLSTLAPTITDEILKRRLELALISYIRGERDAAGTLALFQRAEKVGGLALAEGEARSLLAATDAALAHVRVTDEVAEDLVDSQPSREASAGASVALAKGYRQLTVDRKEEESRPLNSPVQSNPVFLDIIPPDHQILAAPERVEIPVLTPEPLLIEEQTLHSIQQDPSAEPQDDTVKEEFPTLTPNPQPLNPSLVTADHFSEVDAVEVAVFEDRAKDVGSAAPKMNAEKLLENTVASLSGGLDEEGVKRLRNIIDARFRNVRDAYATRAVLEAPLEKGGMGLRGRDLANALEVIESAAVTEDARLFAEHKQKLTDEIAKRHADAREEEQELVSSETPVLPHTPHPNPTPHPDVLPIKNAILSAASVSQTPGERPRLDDIRSAPRLVGPLEELQTMSLTEFRRLSPDVPTAVAKVRDKVALLEDQGFEKKIAAVNAWRSSPLSQLYLEISREALQTGSPVLPLLERRKAEGKEALTWDEWHAVMALNAELRF